MTRSRPIPVRCLLAIVVLSFPGHALADSMQCGRRIVATGDPLHAVRAACGEPASQRHRSETRSVQRRVEVDCGAPEAPHRRCVRVETVTRDVQIDEWVYDFGPRRFVQHLTFVDGWLETIEAGGRGGGQPRAAGSHG